MTRVTRISAAAVLAAMTLLLLPGQAHAGTQMPQAGPESGCGLPMLGDMAGDLPVVGSLLCGLLGNVGGATGGLPVVGGLTGGLTGR